MGLLDGVGDFLSEVWEGATQPSQDQILKAMAVARQQKQDSQGAETHALDLQMKKAQLAAMGPKAELSALSEKLGLVPKLAALPQTEEMTPLPEGQAGPPSFALKPRGTFDIGMGYKADLDAVNRQQQQDEEEKHRRALEQKAVAPEIAAGASRYRVDHRPPAGGSNAGFQFDSRVIDAMARAEASGRPMKIPTRPAAIQAWHDSVLRAVENDPNFNSATAQGKYDTTKSVLAQQLRMQANIVGMAGTAAPSLDRLVELGSELTDTGYPALNSVVRWAQDQLGDPRIAAFEALRVASLTEVARLITSPTAGGVLSDSARKEWLGQIHSNATVEQIIKVKHEIDSELLTRLGSQGAVTDYYRKALGGEVTGTGLSNAAFTGGTTGRNSQMPGSGTASAPGKPKYDPATMGRSYTRKSTGPNRHYAVINGQETEVQK